MAQVRTPGSTFVRAHDQDGNLTVGAVALVDGAAPGFPNFKDHLLQRLTPNLEGVDHRGFDVADRLRRTPVSRPAVTSGSWPRVWNSAWPGWSR